jgi:hypothetical protein
VIPSFVNYSYDIYNNLSQLFSTLWLADDALITQNVIDTFETFERVSEETNASIV